MSKVKPITPYQRLLDEAMRFVSSVRHPQKRDMFFVATKNLCSNIPYSLDDVYQRTLAAHELGYEVVIEADKEGMAFRYRRKPKYDELPWSLR